MGSWKDSYCVNIEVIDIQHKELFNILDKCYDLLLKSKDKDNYDEVISILLNLKEYTIYHFKTEEKFMKENNYSKFLSHKFAHDSFIEKINTFDPYSVDKDTTTSLKNILEFVSQWIKDHILDVDMKIPQYLKK